MINCHLCAAKVPGEYGLKLRNKGWNRLAYHLTDRYRERLDTLFFCPDHLPEAIKAACLKAIFGDMDDMQKSI